MRSNPKEEMVSLCATSPFVAVDLQEPMPERMEYSPLLLITKKFIF
jgi:hypothetical protein